MEKIYCESVKVGNLSLKQRRYIPIYCLSQRNLKTLQTWFIVKHGNNLEIILWEGMGLYGGGRGKIKMGYRFLSEPLDFCFSL
jgi:hypothetical protein